MSMHAYRSLFLNIPTNAQSHPRPVAGQPTYLLVNMSGLEHPGVVVHIALVDYNGRHLFSNETRIHSENPYLYYVGPFLPPKGFFFVRVNGEDAQVSGRSPPPAIAVGATFRVMNSCALP